MATNLDVITDAFRVAGILNEKSTLSGSKGQAGLTLLNDMMSDWEEDGIMHFLRYRTLPHPIGENMEPLQVWEGELNACTYCAFCKSVCPVFADIKWDSVSPKGQNMSAYFMLQGELKPDDDLVKRLYQCTMCLDCTRKCPTTIEVAEIVTAARTGLVNAGYKNPVHEGIIANVEKTNNIYGEEEVVPPQEGEALLFLGCGYQQRPNTVKKFVRILDKLGVKAKIVEETCCGYPLKILGYEDAYKKQKEQFKKMIPQGDVITFCPTCYMFIEEEYEDNNKPLHILEVIAEKLKEVDIKPVGGKVAYHDPCHLARGAGIIEPPREILKAIGTELVEMAKSKELTQCCGGGGGIITSDADLSGRMGKARAEQAMAVGAETLTTVCPTCELTLRAGAMAAENGSKIKVANMLDLIWKAIK